MTAPFLIIGAGQAGLKAAETLRHAGYDGDLVLIGDEPQLPYQRPPLSKAYLKGEMDDERLLLRPQAYFDTASIEVRAGTCAVRIDPAAHRVELADGSRLAYRRLLLATGTRARQLPIAGADRAGVLTLRTIADIAPIRAALDAVEDVAIIGGGYIGMEFAAVAADFGRRVTVIEARPRVLERSVAPQISAWFEALHRARGVRLALGTGVARILGDPAATGVELADGTIIPAGLVLVAVGAEPVTGLAAGAGLAVDDGIAVDACCRTAAPDIYAAGDCASFPSARYGRRLRLESVQNAVDQARAAAAAMVGDAVAYDPVPWFWSDQYDAKLQIAGLSTGYDRTEIDGDPDSGSFALAYYAGDRLLAVDAVNAPRAHMLARRTLAADAPASGPASLARAG
ncbi:NAD(P)/FAD-dependent oxidoreductase [Polymorphum gilvum]|uniref:Pyridine nucleotide-disulfide oxidoreductase, putative n=1 Tax=Polymorphum gilvum (strain LMG 25793 / CGMCC 1.9160 / SL003B-26A1) TaxID=991905 RepID=F2IYU6_POLGS|nr:FAD-dependent oxidoreductase [Polymorphum gilvum]ADZ70561.1 Pyridine nucleotide-disulfide oxidoreductase, putative [Polymorphum gilvum SL003B-26A1]